MKKKSKLVNVIIPTSGGLYSPGKQKYIKKNNLMDVFNVFRNIQTNKPIYHCALCTIWCLFKLSSRVNLWKHTEHSKGLSPLCPSTCLFKFPECLNRLPHCEQLKGFSVVWTTKWVFNLLLLGKALKHIEQTWLPPLGCHAES